jgi:hypothetical protein
VYDKSTASSKVSFPHSAIWCFPVQQKSTLLQLVELISFLLFVSWKEADGGKDDDNVTHADRNIHVKSKAFPLQA